MSQQSRIEWTEATWNPTTGCTRCSPGCSNCYALRDTRRLGGNPHPRVRAAYAGLTHVTRDGRVDWSGELRVLPERFPLPLLNRRPTRYFVNSMSDLFHDRNPESSVQDVISVMREASWHTFQVLTKRAVRLRALDPRISWPPNVWMGVSVESANYVHRIDHLRATGAVIKFLSLEPLLGPLPNLNLDGIDWVIVGGESGAAARPMDAAWVRDIRDQCVRARVPFFFKQWGGRNKKLTGRVLDGRTYDEFPTG